MPDYVQNEVKFVRRATGQITSDEESESQAVHRDLILDALSSADENIQSLVLGAGRNSTLFDARKVIQTVANQATYDLPEDIFAGDDVKLVEMSRTGLDKEYFPLMPILRSQVENYPSTSFCDMKRFAKEGRSLILSPPPATAGWYIRITYARLTYDLDVRRGTVSGKTNDGTYYQTITIADDEYLMSSSDSYDSNNYLSVVDEDGVMKHLNVKYSSYAAGARTFTLPASTVAISDGAISAGNFITLGKFKSTHSSLPRICDDYRKQYAVWMIKQIVENNSSLEKFQYLKGMEQEIVRTLKNTLRYVEMPVRGAYAQY